MNGTKTGFFRCLYYSVTSFSKYRLFLRQSTGRVVAYLMLLSFLAAISVSISWFTMANEIIDAISVDVIENIPEFNFENGKLDVYAEMPIVIDGNVPVVIDTRPGINEEQILYQYDNVILITRDKMIQKSYLKREELSWSMYGNMTMNRESLVRIVPMLKSTFVVVFSIFIVIFALFFIAGKFISALIVSLIGLAANSARNTNLTYRNIFKISVYSMTLPLIAGTILDILHVNVPYMWVLYYVASGIYVVGAINNIRRELDAMYSSFDGFGGPGGYGGPGGFGKFNDFGSHDGPGSPGGSDSSSNPGGFGDSDNSNNHSDFGSYGDSDSFSDPDGLDIGGCCNDDYDDFMEEEKGNGPENSGDAGDQSNDPWQG